jgi:tetratricopeptide (TPR) repeat protein
MRRAALLLVLILATPARADESADDHMLAGAQHLQAGRYVEALVEFRVAERLKDRGAAWYVAAALTKMGRAEEALTEFARAEAAAPEERDGLLDYYHALACYEARLYFCADRLLAAIGQEAGPRIAGQARKIRVDLAPLLTAPPPPSSIDWYQAQAAAAFKGGHLALAQAYYEEAVSLAALRPDHYRQADAIGALARVRAALQSRSSAK